MNESISQFASIGKNADFFVEITLEHLELFSQLFGQCQCRIVFSYLVVVSYLTWPHRTANYPAGLRA